MVFSAEYEDDTITVSFGINITKGFPLIPVLIGVGAGVVALAVIIPVAIVASKKKKTRMQGQVPGTQPSYGTPPPPDAGNQQPPSGGQSPPGQGSGKNFCNVCGMKLLPGVVFCPGCGKPIK